MSKCYASTVISLARQEVGYKEKKTNSQLDDKTANAGSGNYNKYAAYIDKNYPDFYSGKKNGYSWCDVFVDCMMIQAYGLDNALKLTCQPKKSLGASCTYSRGYYNSRGQLSATPVLGAQVFFTEGGKITHTGLVVDMNATEVLVCAGNTGDEVKEIWYKRTDPYIKDYGTPKYDPEPVTEANEAFTISLPKDKYSQLVIKLT